MPTNTPTAKPTTSRKPRPHASSDPVEQATAKTQAAAPAASARSPRRSPAGGRARPRTVRVADAAAPATALPSAVPDTPAARALWTALHAGSEATTVDLAAAAGIVRSTATALLAGLAKAGLVTRTPAAGRAAPVNPTVGPPTSGPAAPPHPHPATAASAPTAVTVAARGGVGADAAAGPAGKLAGGQLRDLVATHLHAHPGQEYSPAAIAKTLHRSAGAVANACVRLTVLGQATQTSARPRRYRAATAR